MAKEIYLYSGIYSFTAENFNKEMEAASGQDIDFRVSSGGGDVFAGWPMIAKMGEHTGNIKIKVDGLAASMAAFMLPYADEVEAVEVARIMVHRADMYVREEGEKRLLADINKSLRSQFEKTLDLEAFEKITGKTMDDVFNSEARIDIWLTAKEAKKVGLVNKVVKLEPRVKAESEGLINAIAANAGWKPSEGQKPKSEKENSFINNQKTQIMTIAELKATHPALYAEVIAVGETNERDRVGAFMAFAAVDLDAVKKGIESGEPLTQTATAEFTVKMVNAGRVADLEEGSEGNVDPKGDGKEDVKTEAEIAADAKAKLEFEASEKELYAELGIKAPTA